MWAGLYNAGVIDYMPWDDEDAPDLGDPDDIAYESFSEGEIERLLEGIQHSRAAKAVVHKRGQSSKNTAASSAPTTPSSKYTAPPSTPSTSSTHPAIPATSSQSSSPSPSNASSPGSGSRCCPPIPSICQVTHDDLQDALLAHTYANLVALIAGELIPWSDMTGPGQVALEAWKEQCLTMDLEMALNAVTFVEDDNFINPSRASPKNIEVLPQPGVSNRFYLACNGYPVVRVSSIFLEQSQLLTPGVSAVTQKFIWGIFHSQEWERFVAWVCMAFGHTKLHAQLAKDVLQFSTRPCFDTKDDAKKKRKSMFTNTKSNSTRANGTPNKVSADTLTLPTDAIVPVYDARNTAFNFYSDLPNIANLPVWNGEIPYGSFVTVGYTFSLYCAKSGKWTLGCNIQWVVVVGIPDEDKDDDA